MLKKTLLVLFGCIAVAASSLFVGAASAQAATNPYTAQGVCGSGYSVVASRSLDGTHPAGRVYLLYNASNGYNCVATIKTAHIGTATHTVAGLWVQGNSYYIDDDGYYKYYAVIKLSARDRCVKWGGEATGNNPLSATADDPYYKSWSNDWGYCD